MGHVAFIKRKTQSRAGVTATVTQLHTQLNHINVVIFSCREEENTSTVFVVNLMNVAFLSSEHSVKSHPDTTI